MGMEIEIGMGKRGRRAYGLDEIAIVPSRRTRDPEDVDMTWQLGSFTFDFPLLASAMDGVVDVKFAIKMSKLGGIAALNLEDRWVEVPVHIESDNVTGRQHLTEPTMNNQEDVHERRYFGDAARRHAVSSATRRRAVT